MRQYIKLTMLTGQLVPQEEILTPEEKEERRVQRIINGEGEEQSGLTIFEFGDFRESALYLPIDLIHDFFGVPEGTNLQMGDGGAYLVKESPDEIFEMLYIVGVASLVTEDGN